MTINGKGLQDLASVISEHLGDRFLDAARLLRKAQDEAPEHFAELAELCGMSVRKAYYLAQIDRQFGGLEIDEDRLYGIGWTKLHIIGPHINALNYDSLLSLAEDFTVQQLLSLSQGDEPSLFRWVVLHLLPDQYALFESVLLAHGAVKGPRGLRGKEQALTQILKSTLTA